MTVFLGSWTAPPNLFGSSSRSATKDQILLLIRRCQASRQSAPLMLTAKTGALSKTRSFAARPSRGSNMCSRR